MNLKSINRSDILLAIVAAAGAHGFSRVFVQKVAFLVSEEFKNQLSDDFYEFNKYHYGPFSREVYLDAEMLNDLGCISITYGVDRRDDLYTIEDECYLDDINLPLKLSQYIDDTVAWVKDMSFSELVRAIYLLFPEYRENSRFDYQEDQALADSFARGIRQLHEGKTYSTAQVLDELRKVTTTDGKGN